ncbi:MAG: hypothetical protein A3K68_07335 [Euryarchaeota archaeon RBG_16_68_13]|nr:MAG: hypothetical protein A3K68_07335 [Euryarchaeota archaeon RBG_16_68_13]
MPRCDARTVEPATTACPNCGRTAPPNERFCRTCGTALRVPGKAPPPAPGRMSGRVAVFVLLAVIFGWALYSLYLLSPEWFYACCGLGIVGFFVLISAGVRRKQAGGGRV